MQRPRPAIARIRRQALERRTRNATVGAEISAGPRARMNIVSIGGGPAGLFFAILMKKADPGADIRIYERNRHDDTFGWGVVFSDETLDNIERADPESIREIRRNFIYWSDIDTHYR